MADSQHHIQRSSAEQDRAAGGRDARLLAVGSAGVARASVELKRYKNTGARWAYLRWSFGGRTFNRYLGRVTGTDRFECLQEGWRLARTRGLVSTAATEPSDTRRRR